MCVRVCVYLNFACDFSDLVISHLRYHVTVQFWSLQHFTFQVSGLKILNIHMCGDFIV